MADKPTVKDRVEANPLAWAAGLAIGAGTIVAAAILWIQSERMASRDERIAALETSCATEDISTRRPPGQLPLTEVGPEKKWLLQYLRSLAAAAASDSASGSISAFRVAALRVGPFPGPTPPLTLHLRTGAYSLTTDYAFLVSADGLVYTELRGHSDSPSSLVYTVPSANAGAFLLVPALLTTRTEKNPPPLSAVVATLDP